MNGIETLEALRRANPRHQPGFMDTVAAAADAARPDTITVLQPRAAARPRGRRRTIRVVSGAVAAAVTAALLVLGSPFGTSTVRPAVAMQHAVTVSAAAADASGTVTVTITKDGAPWAGKTVRWNGDDLSVIEDAGREGGRELRLVNGTLYGVDPETPGGFLELGPPDSIDPGSGTTPDEYLALARDDAGGETLRRLTAAMTDLSTAQTDDGSTTYSGTVAAGMLAPETGFKEGQTIRVLPYGYVAHDEAADPASPIAMRITIGPDNTIKEITATWGGASAWTYRLSFSDLGSTPAPAVPDNVRPLRR